VQVAEERVTSQRVLGTSVRRVEDIPLLKGRGTFVNDIVLPGMLHMVVVRSLYAHARVEKVDVSEALKQPGVVDALTGEDVARLTNPIMSYFNPASLAMKSADCYALSFGKVRFVGEPVAAVVANNREEAEDAAEFVTIDYDPLPPVVDAEDALKAGAPVLYEEWGDNLMLQYKFQAGEVEQAFHKADRVIKERLKIHRYTGAPIETRGYLASYDAPTRLLTLWASTQNPHQLRTILAKTLNHPEPLIRVIEPDVGGAFGVKMPSYPEESLTCLFSMRLGKPVKFFEERRENLIVSHQAREQTHYVEVAVKRDGLILGLKEKLIVNLGIYFPTCGPLSNLTCVRFIPGCYKIQNYQCEVMGAVTNKSTYGAYRGYGKDAATYVIERVMDIVARELGLEPLEVRMRNVISPEELPFRTATGALLDSGNYPGALRKVLDLINIEEFKAGQREQRRKGRYLGLGYALVLEPSASHFPDSLLMGFDGATVRLEPSGEVTVLSGSTSTGMGSRTVLGQVVAEELALPFDHVHVAQGDTSICPYGYGNWASRTSVIATNAALLAARQVKEKALAIAGHLMGARENDLIVRDARICSKLDPNKSVSFREIASFAWQMSHPKTFPKEMAPGLEATQYYFPPNLEYVNDEKGRRNAYAAYGYSAQAAVVEVDPETGLVRILRYVIVHDAGRALNPTIVMGQTHGGLAQGIGGALFEHNVYDENGQPLAATFMDYRIPTALEIPDIEIVNVESPSPFLPLGAKGVGEGGAQGASAVLANAVEDALSPFTFKIRELPITPERIWASLKGRETQS
jgi:carbon-monoxide dehydrogenase large subunit